MKIKLLLLGIVLVAALLRFWQLGVNPPSLTWDEVAWGYNAYSLGIDGRDEFGRFLPLDYLESFGDYKPPVYAYLDVVPVKIFGLNEFATRFPSAFLGTCAVLVTYFLVKRLFPKSEKKHWYALAAALFLALSPWHIMLSRAAFEANVAMFFILVGVWQFLAFTQNKKPYALFFSMLAFVVSVNTFNSARVVAPLLVLILAGAFWKILWEKKMIVILMTIIGLALLIPFIHFSLSPQAKLRYNEVNIFSDVSLVENANQQIANDHNAWWSKILHNRRAVYTVAYLQHYFDNLSPSFLFIQGDGNPKFSTRDVGELYLWDLPFLLIGIFFLFRKKLGSWWLLPVWLLLAIVPAAVARETPHALRTENMLPTWQVCTAVGFIEAVYFLKKYRSLFMTVTLAMLLVCVVYFEHGYIVQYPSEFSGEWQYGYVAALSYAKAYEGQYQHVVITQELGRPYVYTLFYNKISPTTFRQTSVVKRDAFGFVDVTQVGKYLFPDKITPMQNTLYIVAPDEVPNHVRILQTFPLLNGKPSLVAYTL